jgi:thiol-disulfide isomerase/thioredoxin
MYARLIKVAFVISLATCASCARRGPDARAREALDGFQSFAFNFELPDLDGKKVSLADYKGKVVIVDIWGTWCPPCREEIPEFLDLYQRQHAAGLEIIGINYEGVPGDEARLRVRNFVSEHRIPYPCVIGDESTKRMIPAFGGYPTTLFIDRSGKVRMSLTGSATLPELEAIVSILLKEPSNSRV